MMHYARCFSAAAATDDDDDVLLLFGDVNECTERRHQLPCSRGEVCINTEGSYECQREVADQGPPGDDSDYLPPTTTTTEPAGHNGNCGTGFSYNRHTRQCEGISFSHCLVLEFSLPSNHRVLCRCILLLIGILHTMSKSML